MNTNMSNIYSTHYIFQIIKYWIYILFTNCFDFNKVFDYNHITITSITILYNYPSYYNIQYLIRLCYDNNQLYKDDLLQQVFKSEYKFIISNQWSIKTTNELNQIFKNTSYSLIHLLGLLIELEENVSKLHVLIDLNIIHHLSREYQNLWNAINITFTKSILNDDKITIWLGDIYQSSLISSKAILSELTLSKLLNIYLEQLYHLKSIGKILVLLNREELVQYLIKNLSHDDHIIRYHSCISLGNICQLITQSHIFEMIIKCLLIHVNDKIGNVRVASFQAIGKLFEDGLYLLETISLNIQQYDDLFYILIQAFTNGMKDSKLTCRMQAMWSLGNVLLLLLPYRQQYLFPSIQQRAPISNQEIYLQLQVLNDQMWGDCILVCLEALHDSTKIYASSIRCLGLLACGLSPYDSDHFSFTTGMSP